MESQVGISSSAGRTGRGHTPTSRWAQQPVTRLAHVLDLGLQGSGKCNALPSRFKSRLNYI